MTPRKRRRDRGAPEAQYPIGSALGSPENAERVAVGLAIVDFGELSDRERQLVISTARVFSGYVFDLEEQVSQMQERLLEMVRMWG